MAIGFLSLNSDKFYAKSEEKYLKTTIVYSDANAKLYKDKDLTNELLADEAMDLCLTGDLLIGDTYGVYVKPIGFVELDDHSLTSIYAYSQLGTSSAQLQDYHALAGESK